MKNNYKYLFFILLFFFLKVNQLYSDEFTFEAPEIQISNNGNKVVAINGVKILSDDGVKINAENVKYDKINLTLVAEGKVKIFDTLLVDFAKNLALFRDTYVMPHGKLFINSKYNKVN